MDTLRCGTSIKLGEFFVGVLMNKKPCYLEFVLGSLILGKFHAVARSAGGQSCV